MSPLSSIAAFAVLFFLIAGVALAPPAVSAQAPAPQIVFSGNGLTIANGDSTPQVLDGTDFGTTVEGAAVPHAFVIGNTGTANLSVTDLSVPAGFTVSAPAGLPGTVPPGSVMLILVTCDAKAAGGYSGSLSVVSNDPDEGKAGFTITCRVNGRPEIDVAGNTIPIANNDTTPSTADATDFGNTVLNAPVTHAFRVANRGLGDLMIGAVTLPPGFTALNTLPATLPPGGQADLQVRCDATAAFSYAGNVTIVNNDADENPFVFRIRCAIGDASPDFNPGPGDLPPATATVVSSPVTVTVPTPPPGSGGDSGSDSSGDPSSNGSQGGGSQVNATAATATSTPPRPTPTPVSTAVAPAGSSQGIFRPPSTGDAGLEDSGTGLPARAEAAAAGAILAGVSVYAVRRVFR